MYQIEFNAYLIVDVKKLKQTVLRLQAVNRSALKPPPELRLKKENLPLQKFQNLQRQYVYVVLIIFFSNIYIYGLNAKNAIFFLSNEVIFTIILN